MNYWKKFQIIFSLPSFWLADLFEDFNKIVLEDIDYLGNLNKKVLAYILYKLNQLYGSCIIPTFGQTYYTYKSKISLSQDKQFSSSQLLFWSLIDPS